MGLFDDPDAVYNRRLAAFTTWLETCQPGFINIKSKADRKARARQYFATYLQVGKLPDLPEETEFLVRKSRGYPRALGLHVIPHPSKKVKDHLSNLERQLLQLLMRPRCRGYYELYGLFQEKIKFLIADKQNPIDRVVGWYLETMIFRKIDLIQISRSFAWRLMLYNLLNQLTREGFSHPSVCNLIDYVLSIFGNSAYLYSLILSDSNAVQQLRRQVKARLGGSDTHTKEAVDRAIINACNLEILMDLIDRNLKLEVQNLDRNWEPIHRRPDSSDPSTSQWGTQDIVNLVSVDGETHWTSEWRASDPEPTDSSLDPGVEARIQTVESMSDSEKLVMYARICMWDWEVVFRENQDPQLIPKAVSRILEPATVSLPPEITIRGPCRRSDLGCQTTTPLRSLDDDVGT